MGLSPQQNEHLVGGGKHIPDQFLIREQLIFPLFFDSGKNTQNVLWMSNHSMDRKTTDT